VNGTVEPNCADVLLRIYSLVEQVSVGRQFHKCLSTVTTDSKCRQI